METLQVNAAFDQGEELLAISHHALEYTKNEDSAYLACTNAKDALVHYLTSFLLHYGENVYSQDAEVLLNQCRELSGNYFDLNIAELLKWDSGQVGPTLNLAKQLTAMAEFARELMICELL